VAKAVSSTSSSDRLRWQPQTACLFISFPACMHGIKLHARMIFLSFLHHVFPFFLQVRGMSSYMYAQTYARTHLRRTYMYGCAVIRACELASVYAYVWACICTYMLRTHTHTLSLSHTHIHTHSLPTPAHTQHIRIKNTQAEVEDLSAVACTCITAVGTPASKALRGCSK
jgi:hypothetical protein